MCENNIPCIDTLVPVITIIVMSTSLKLQTLENCTTHLEVILKNPGRRTIHFLTKRGFIREEDGEEVLDAKSMLSKREKAGKLMEAINDAVMLDKGKFHCSC